MSEPPGDRAMGIHVKMPGCSELKKLLTPSRLQLYLQSLCQDGTFEMPQKSSSEIGCAGCRSPETPSTLSPKTAAINPELHDSSNQVLQSSEKRRSRGGPVRCGMPDCLSSSNVFSKS